MPYRAPYRMVIFTSVFWLLSAPALAMDRNDMDRNSVNAPPRAIKSFAVGDRHIEVAAVGRNSRADTLLRREHLDECRAMAKVMPGYPQPAFVSFDIRLKF